MVSTKERPTQISAMKAQGSTLTPIITYSPTAFGPKTSLPQLSLFPQPNPTRLDLNPKINLSSKPNSSSQSTQIFSEFLQPSESIFTSLGRKKPSEESPSKISTEGKINTEEENFLFVNRFSSRTSMSTRNTVPGPPTSRFSIRPKEVKANDEQRLLQAHLDLLDTKRSSVNNTEIAAAPIFSASILKKHNEEFKQYGFLAGISSILEKNKQDMLRDDPRLFFNISSPLSTFICGSQGSGKSHTLSCLLENCLMKSDVSQLDNPLAALVFHYDTFTSDTCGTPCEAAYLSSNPEIKVRVFCSPTNIETIKRTYKDLNVKIEPLLISETDLNTKRMLNLMAVNTEDGPMPLYLHLISRILRELRLEQQQKKTSFSYSLFKQKVSSVQITPAQMSPLNQRLDTLESFMPKSQTKAQFYSSSFSRSSNLSSVSNKSEEKGNDWSSKPGTLTILDLSCPCVTSESACALFNMCLELFLEKSNDVGRIVALDEAHKYMNATAEASTLTSTLLSSIRLQRHLGTRIFISTQEPTISPKLLDLCSVTIVHRFSSPEWLCCLKKHIAALNTEQLQLLGSESGLLTNADENCKISTQENILTQIVKLGVGEALLFAPSAFIEEKKLGIGYLQVRIRDRLTSDGGKSILAI
ncbi:putative p-loop containing nucleoside triphosphate hydrolase [Golovinomyces cichoracearum]|uniref:Putative p-loop containing nucleoside triphosphate hydrolase n=1 Tax=Golovinomyces cichoracearum TaxID=62708 RepID=A0A420HP68_9PEZI|nr:putative p-loop containing nucleoside triphosphate hydrolase [Golovinomyces cichoracearum]